MKTSKNYNIHIERAKRKMSQQELADNVGTSRQTIHLLETGKTDPKLSLIIKIARFFSVKVSDIINE